MVDSPQGPGNPPEQLETDSLTRPRQEPPPGLFAMMEEMLPVFLVCGGILASVVLFFSGGSLFVFWIIAAIVCRLHRQSHREPERGRECRFLVWLAAGAVWSLAGSGDRWSAMLPYVRLKTQSPSIRMPRLRNTVRMVRQQKTRHVLPTGWTSRPECHREYESFTLSRLRQLCFKTRKNLPKMRKANRNVSNRAGARRGDHELSTQRSGQ